MSPIRVISLPILLLAACQGSKDEDTAGVTDGDTPIPSETTPDMPEKLCMIDVQCPGDILDTPKTPCTLQITDGLGGEVYNGPAGFELRGRSSLTFPKKQYSVELRDYNELPVWPGYTWQYLADGTDLGTAWTDPNFDDSSWTAAPTPIGYGTGYLATTIEPNNGPDGQSVTTYFRHEFTPYSVASIKNLELGVLRNDGVVVYLNGVEVLRDNLPSNPSYDTLATTAITFAEEIIWVAEDIDPALLVEGTNVLAVEMHQADLASPDMRFNAYLEASGESASTNLLSMGAEDDWIFNGQYVDRSLFRNRLAYDVFQSFGGPERYAPELRFCELDLNGEYLGVYTIGEKIDRDDDRVDIAEDGFIVKLDEVDGFHPNAVGYGTWQLVYPDDGNVADEERVSAYLTDWETAILTDPLDPDTGVFAYLDMDSAVDWVLLNELMKNHDAYFLSVYLWKDASGKMFFAPWDLDLSLGYPYTDCGTTGWIPRTYFDATGQSQNIPYIQVMAEIPAFQEALVTRWEALRANELSDETLLALIAQYDATLAPAIEANFARWPIEDIAFQTDYVANWLCPVSSYEEEHERTVAFLLARAAWMDATIDTF